MCDNKVFAVSASDCNGDLDVNAIIGFDFGCYSWYFYAFEDEEGAINVGPLSGHKFTTVDSMLEFIETEYGMSIDFDIHGENKEFYNFSAMDVDVVEKLSGIDSFQCNDGNIIFAKEFGQSIIPKTLERMQAVFYRTLFLHKEDMRASQGSLYALLNSAWDGIGPWQK